MNQNDFDTCVAGRISITHQKSQLDVLQLFLPLDSMMESFSKRSKYAPFAKEVIAPICVMLLGTAILSIIQIHNGFPLVLGDSRGYIERGFRMTESSHWSNSYAAFITLIYKVFGSVQFVAIIQNFIISFSLFTFCKYYLEKFNSYKFLSIISILIFTALPWVSTMVMSDIFTPVCILSIILILDKPLKIIERLALFSVLFIGLSAHQSHLMIIPLFIFTVLLIQWIFKRVDNKKIVIQNLAILILLFFFSNVFEKNVMNKRTNANADVMEIGDSNVQGPDISTGYYFIAIRIREAGQLELLLEGFCADSKENYLCEFAKTGKTPRIKNVKYSDRNQNNALYVKYASDNKEFVLYSLTKPRFYYAMASLVVKRGFGLLKNTRIRKYHSLTKAGNDQFAFLLSKINQKDAVAYRASKQVVEVYRIMIRDHYHKVDRFWWRIILPLTLIIFVFLSFWFRRNIKVNSDLYFAISFLLIGHFINCIICGVFSNYGNLRYSSRTVWLLNFSILLVLFTSFVFWNKKSKDLNEPSSDEMQATR